MGEPAASYEERRRRLAASFAEGGARYAELRPAYPVAAVDWLVGGGAPRDVVDVGAGTGKLTGVLAALGHRVVAVEPSADMLTTLRGDHPGVAAYEGTGEATRLPAGSADVVTYAQAWHWVEPAAASAEAARILRPGGVLGLIWNFLDLDDPAAARVHAAMRSLDGPEPAPYDDESARGVTGAFTHEEGRDFRWVLPTTTAAVAALVTTRSYYLDAAPRGRELLERRVGEAVTEAYGPVGDLRVDLPYRTRAHRFRVAG